MLALHYINGRRVELLYFIKNFIFRLILYYTHYNITHNITTKNTYYIEWTMLD